MFPPSTILSFFPLSQTAHFYCRPSFRKWWKKFRLNVVGSLIFQTKASQCFPPFRWNVNDYQHLGQRNIHLSSVKGSRFCIVKCFVCFVGCLENISYCVLADRFRIPAFINKKNYRVFSNRFSSLIIDINSFQSWIF